MDLKSYVSGRGAQSQLAAQIVAQPQLVWQWANRVKQVPADRCPAIERASDGACTCEELRPDLKWRRVADETWPWHAAGRPLLDLTPVEAEEIRDAA